MRSSISWMRFFSVTFIYGSFLLLAPHALFLVQYFKHPMLIASAHKTTTDVAFPSSHLMKPIARFRAILHSKHALHHTPPLHAVLPQPSPHAALHTLSLLISKHKLRELRRLLLRKRVFWECHL